MVIEKIVLKAGNKKIKFTQFEYEELRQHFREWAPYPFHPRPVVWPVYPMPSPTVFPPITYTTTTGKTGEWVDINNNNMAEVNFIN